MQPGTNVPDIHTCIASCHSETYCASHMLFAALGVVLPPLHCSASVLLRCGLGHPNTALRTASMSASTSSGFAQTSTTAVGSFNMLPVVIQTIRSSASISPSASEIHFTIHVYRSIHLVHCLRTAFASLKIVLRFISLDALTLSFVWA